MKVKPEGLLSLWLTNIKSAETMSAALARWGISKGELTAFLAGQEGLPIPALMTISADSGITVDQLLRDYSLAALLKIPAPIPNPRAHNYVPIIQYSVVRSMRKLYGGPEEAEGTLILRAWKGGYVAPLGKLELSTGIKFERPVVMELAQHHQNFPPKDFTLRVKRGPIHVMVDVIQFAGGYNRLVKEGTILGTVTVAPAGRRRLKARGSDDGAESDEAPILPDPVGVSQSGS